MRGCQRTPQIRMRVGSTGDDEIGMQRHDFLDVRLDASDARKTLHIVRIVREIVGADNLRSASEGEDHLGDVGSEGDDAANLVWRVFRLCARKKQKAEGRRQKAALSSGRLLLLLRCRWECPGARRRRRTSAWRR